MATTKTTTVPKRRPTPVKKLSSGKKYKVGKIKNAKQLIAYACASCSSNS